MTLPYEGDGWRWGVTQYPISWIEVSVLPEDIRRGRRGIPHLCPVALAASRVTDAPCEAVGGCVWIGSPNPQFGIARNQREIGSLMIAYDEGGRFPDGVTFTLDIYELRAEAVSLQMAEGPEGTKE